MGELVASRLGDEVLDRLVEPLLGGVYAGHARELSARATVPQLVRLVEQGPLLGATLPASDVPVFAGLPGGMGGLTQTLAGRLEVRTGAAVRQLSRTEDGFALVVGPTSAPELVEADAVVLAVPATPASRLLVDLVPVAAAELAGIESASMVVVSLAFEASAVSRDEMADSSGFLVPPVEGRSIKASTFSFAKWAWVGAAGEREGLLHLRTSMGRHREETLLQRDDDELVAVSLAELRAAVGLDAPPVDAHVQRWGGALPQYAVGHLDRVARIRAAMDEVPRLVGCGAAYDGVGVPAVIASAHRAARDLLGTMGP